MRTKTLLLTAALAVAGIASSKAQVYSVNAVGYVNTTLPKGFTLLSNPLDNKAGNKVSDLFKNITPAPIPNGVKVFIYNNASGTYLTATYDDLDGAFGGEGASAALNPGDGAYVFNPTTTTLTVTFVGEVPQGNLVNPFPAGFSIKSSMVPQAGNAQTVLGFPATASNGDKVFRWNKATQAYETSTFDDLDNAWGPALPNLDVGEAVFVYSKSGGTWNRTFSVNS